MLMLVNRETGKGLGVTLFDRKKAMRRGDEALKAMNPGSTEPPHISRVLRGAGTNDVLVIDRNPLVGIGGTPTGGSLSERTWFQPRHAGASGR
jgi:hypothetical protein